MASYQAKEITKQIMKHKFTFTVYLFNNYCSIQTRQLATTTALITL